MCVMLQKYIFLTFNLKVQRHLSEQVWQIHRADVRPRVKHFSLLQEQGCISFLVQSLKVQRGSFFLRVSEAVSLPIVSQNQPSAASELVPPFDGESSPIQRRGRVDPKAAVQLHGLPESGLY